MKCVTSHFSTLVKLISNLPIRAVAVPRGGLGRVPPLLTKINFLICPNLMRKCWGEGGEGTLARFLNWCANQIA